MKACIACALCFITVTVVVRDNGPLIIAHAAQPASQPAALPSASVGATTVVGASVLGRFLAEYEESLQALVSYRALRRLSVVARGGKMTASLKARTSLDPVNGFQFEVLEESGFGMLRSRVLHGALEAERDAKRREKGAHGALTAANYTFGAGELTPDGMLRVAIHPLRKDSLLVEGSILLDERGRRSGPDGGPAGEAAVILDEESAHRQGLRAHWWRPGPDRDGIDRRDPLCRPIDVLDELRVRIDQRRRGPSPWSRRVPAVSARYFC